MSYVSKNPRFNSQILTDQGTNSVDDPASGSHKVVNRNGLLYMRDSSGNETAIGSAGATGGINYIDNPSAETGTDGWATYANTVAAATPEDGTGGSANVTLTRTTTAGEILRGDASFELTVPANSQGEGFSYDFTIDKADQNKVLGIWFDVDATDANYVDDDLQVFIYDKDQSQLITPTSPTNGYKIKGNQYRQRVAFAPYDTSSNDYRLIIHVAADNASGYSVRFDNFEVGPGAIMTGFDGIWKSYSEANGDFTVTGTNWTTVKATARPFKDTSGTWFVDLSINGTLSSTTASFTMTVSGLDFAGTTDRESGYGFVTGGTSGNQAAFVQANASSVGTDILIRRDSTQTFDRILIGGIFELDSKPTWADFDPIATIYPSTEDLALSGWQSYTPTNTQGFGTITSNLQWRRNGQNVEIQGRFTAGTVSASEAQIELPNSYTISFASSTSGEVRVGTISRDLAGDPCIGSVLATEGDTFFNIGRFSRTVDINTLAPINASQFISNSESVSFFASVPVAEFADLGQVPPIGVELASDTQYGLVKKNLSQDVVLTTQLTSPSVGTTVLQATGLTPGERYRVTGQLFFEMPASSSLVVAFDELAGAFDGSKKPAIQRATGTAAQDVVVPINLEYEQPAATTTLTLKVASKGGSPNIDGSNASYSLCYMTVTRLSNTAAN